MNLHGFILIILKTQSMYVYIKIPTFSHVGNIDFQFLKKENIFFSICTKDVQAKKHKLKVKIWVAKYIKIKETAKVK